MGEGNKGRVVFMPDIEYKAWCNRNAKLIDEIIKKGQVSTAWLNTEPNKKFLIRRLAELGYKINL